MSPDGLLQGKEMERPLPVKSAFTGSLTPQCAPIAGSWKGRASYAHARELMRATYSHARAAAPAIAHAMRPPLLLKPTAPTSPLAA